MNKSKAIEVYLKHSSHIVRTLPRLMKWEENLDIKENSISLGLTMEYTRKFARTFGLNFKKRDYPFNMRLIKKRDLRLSAIKCLRNTNWTFSQIGKLFNLSKQRVEQIYSENHYS